VPTGEIPVIRLDGERFDLGSCLGQCIVRVRAVPVSVEVSGASQWSVQYCWNHRGPFGACTSARHYPPNTFVAS
jgi:hypothetical protein